MTRVETIGTLAELLERNREWSARMRASDPEFFARLAHQQAPEYLWIGCSDSRVPANEIVDLPPGQVFVHRNIANQVVPGDANSHAVLGYALEMLGVREVIVGVTDAAVRATLELRGIRHSCDVVVPGWRALHAGVTGCQTKA